MEKKIEDYLHLYLGVMCQVESFNEPHKLTGISYDDTDGKLWCYFENTELGYAPINKVKTILRPLSDMTEQERGEYQAIRFNDNFKLLPWHCDTFFESTRYLLSKHFDLFGLIDNGLAISKPTK